MELRADIQSAIIKLAEQYGLAQVILFGSRARGDHHKRSDIDLAARGGDVMRFSLAVDEEVPTLLMFDVVDLDQQVQPELLAAIKKDGVSLYEKV